METGRASSRRLFNHNSLVYSSPVFNPIGESVHLIGREIRKGKFMSVTRPATAWHQKLFTVLWIWISFRTLLPWLVFFRLTFEGPSYSWGTEYFGRMFHSSGLARIDFLVVYALLAVGIFILYQLRHYNFRLAASAVLIYLAFFAANAVYELLRGEPVIFQGDTLGVTMNVSAAFFVLQFGMLLVGVAWWFGIRGVTTGECRPLSGRRRTIVKLCVAFVPVQLVLLIFGEPHALTDEIGVIGTLIQGALLAWAFYPGSDYCRPEHAPSLN